MLIYAMDIGGTSIKQAYIDPTCDVKPIVERLTTVFHKSNTFKDLKQLVLQLAHNAIASQREITTIAISTTGGVDSNGIVMSSGFFSGYSNISWEAIFHDSFNKIKNVFIINDGRASAWAEYMACNRKPDIFVHFVLGTGIGGSTIINNELLTGVFGAAGYLGHIKVSDDKTEKCSCGKMGCVETLASDSAIIRHYKEMKGKIHSNFTLKDVVTAYLNNDKFAIKSIKIAAKYLGIAISDIMNILNPGIITIGGGVALALEHGQTNSIFLQSVIESVKNNAHQQTLLSNIRLAKHGNDGGMIGAAARAFAIYY